MIFKILIIICVLLGVDMFFAAKTKKIDYEKIVNLFTLETAIELEQEKHLVLIGMGGGMANAVNMLSMSFNLCYEVTLEEAREIAVYAVEKYLRVINTNEAIRERLHHYPFTPKDVKIGIYIQKPDRCPVPEGNIGFVLADNAYLRYKLKESKETEEALGYPRPYFLQEPYEEAFAKVKASCILFD